MTKIGIKQEWYKHTHADWKPVKKALAQALLSGFFANRRRHGGMEIVVDGDKWIVTCISQSKNPFWRSRGFSYYFHKKGSRSIVRISDHWSFAKGHNRSKKFNCGSIASCFWNIKSACEKFVWNIPGERYESWFLAASCSSFMQHEQSEEYC